VRRKAIPPPVSYSRVQCFRMPFEVTTLSARATEKLIRRGRAPHLSAPHGSRNSSIAPSRIRRPQITGLRKSRPHVIQSYSPRSPQFPAHPARRESATCSGRSDTGARTAPRDLCFHRRSVRAHTVRSCKVVFSGQPSGLRCRAISRQCRRTNAIGGHSVIYVRTTNGRPLREHLTPAERARLIETWYPPIMTGSPKRWSS
jgi:hypothetical protein